MVEEEYIGELKLMFTTEGWSYFMEDMEQALADLNTLDNITDLETFYERKGRIKALTILLGFENAIEQLEAENDESYEETL